MLLSRFGSWEASKPYGNSFCRRAEENGNEPQHFQRTERRPAVHYGSLRFSDSRISGWFDFSLGTHSFPSIAKECIGSSSYAGMRKAIKFQDEKYTDVFLGGRAFAPTDDGLSRADKVLTVKKVTLR